MYYRHRTEKEGKKRRRRKSFFPTAFFFLFVSAYNHLSALCLDAEEGKKGEK
jgi:hypothetical protein